MTTQTKTMPHRHRTYRLAASYLKAELEGCERQSVPLPVVGIVCGSGLSSLSENMTNTLTVPYKDVPGLNDSTVRGHKNEIVFGLLGNSSSRDCDCEDGIPTVCFRGRFHYYEGHDMDTVALPVRIMRCLGVRVVIITNAAGGLNPNYEVGNIVSIGDHLALPMLAGNNPLRGLNDDEMGPRFPPTSNAYDEELRNITIKCASKLEMKNLMRMNGTYCFVSGPMYESRAECRFLRNAGGDSVGMSTVPEIVAAHHCGLKVCCLSIITNKVIVNGDEGPAASHEEVLEAVKNGSCHIQSLVTEMVKCIGHEYVPKLEPLKPITSIQHQTATLLLPSAFVQEKMTTSGKSDDQDEEKKEDLVSGAYEA